MSIAGIDITAPNPANNRKKLDSMQKLVKKSIGVTVEKIGQVSRLPKAPTSHMLLKPIVIILWFFVIAYIFGNYGLVGIDGLANLLVSAFSFIKVNMVWGLIDGDTWIAGLSAYVIAMIYFDILLLFPLIYFLSLRKDPVERFLGFFRLEVFILIILIIPLMTTSLFYVAFGDNQAEREHNVENFQIDTKSKWTQLVEGPLCPLIHLGNPQTCLETADPIETEKTNRVDYDIYFNDANIPPIVEDFEKWKQKPFYLNYEVMAKGEPIYLEKVECYQEKVDEEHLLSSMSIPEENQKILSNDRAAIRGPVCDLSKATTDASIQKDYKLIVLLYYSFESTYSLSVPVYNMDIYLENKFGDSEYANIYSEEANIREEIKNDIKVKVPHNSLKVTPYSSPALPIFLGDNYQDRKDYTITFNFEKQAIRDTMVSSEIIDYNIPSMFVQNCYESDCESIKGPLVTYDDRSQIVVDFSVEDPQLDRESYVQNINFNVKSDFYTKDTITLVVKNPDWVEESSSVDGISPAENNLFDRYESLKSDYKEFDSQNTGHNLDMVVGIESTISEINYIETKLTSDVDLSDSDRDRFISEFKTKLDILDSQIDEWKKG